ARPRPQRAPISRGSRLRPGLQVSRSSAHHQIVAMDHLVPATVAEAGFDFTALVAPDEPGILPPTGPKTTRPLAPFSVHDAHGSAALELSRNFLHAGGQQAFALAQRLERAVIDRETADGLQGARDPLLARIARRCRRQEPGATRTFCDRGD